MNITYYIVTVDDANCLLYKQRFFVEAANYEDACKKARKVADTFYDVPDTLYVYPNPVSDILAKLTELDIYDKKNYSL